MDSHGRCLSLSGSKRRYLQCLAGLQQARLFTESAGATGIVLTKLDGTAKGGVVVAISRELGLPVRYVGVGEKAGDLLPFDPKEVIACPALHRLFLLALLEQDAFGVA